VLPELGPHRTSGVVVGKLQLDGGESRRGSSGEPLDKGALGEQVGEIGAEAGHGVGFA